MYKKKTHNEVLVARKFPTLEEFKAALAREREKQEYAQIERELAVSDEQEDI